MVKSGIYPTRSRDSTAPRLPPSKTISIAAALASRKFVNLRCGIRFQSWQSKPSYSYSNFLFVG